MRMYVSWLLSRAGHVAIAVYDEYTRTDTGRGHLILTSVITSLLSRRDREGKDERAARNLNREINCGERKARSEMEAWLFEKERKSRLDGTFFFLSNADLYVRGF